MKKEQNWKITAEQKQYYLNNNGTRCPYCKSRDIHTMPPLNDAWNTSTVFTEVTCYSCNTGWKDVHKLIDIIHRHQTVEQAGY